MVITEWVWKFFFRFVEFFYKKVKQKLSNHVVCTFLNHLFKTD